MDLKHRLQLHAWLDIMHTLIELNHSINVAELVHLTHISYSHIIRSLLNLEKQKYIKIYKNRNLTTVELTETGRTLALKSRQLINELDGTK